MLNFVDGFDHYAGTSDLMSRSGAVQYTLCTGGPSSQGQGRNFNAKTWQGNILGVTSQRLASHFIGASVRGADVDMFFQFYDGVAADYQIFVIFRVRNFTIEVWRGNPNNGGTLLYRTANNVWSTNTDNFIEVWPVINSSSGSVTVHVNHIELVHITGQNTQNTANAWWDRFEIWNCSVDDLYYCDTVAGPGSNPCSSFLGDPRSYTLFPVSNNSVAFTPNAGANWQEVSEIAFDGDVSYNYSPNIGDQDTFNVGSLPSTANTFFGVQTTGAYRKDDAGVRKMDNILISNGTTATSADHVLSDTNYVYFSEMFGVDPHTAADWTFANINAIKIGYKVAA